MTDRVHECLDGRLPRSELTEEERRELDELEAVIHGSLAFAREAPAPDLAPDVMARIREVEPDPSGRRRSRRTVPELLEEVAAWLWTPRPIRIRPAWALVALLVLALGVGGLPLRDLPMAVPGPGITAGETGQAVVYVRFELEASEASSVSLAGTFTGWEPSYELVETTPGRWTGLVPLRPGVHEYAFVVDGERWVPDPDAPTVSDGFGGVNSRIALVAPRQGRSGGTS